MVRREVAEEEGGGFVVVLTEVGVFIVGGGGGVLVERGGEGEGEGFGRDGGWEEGEVEVEEGGEVLLLWWIWHHLF